MTRRARAEENFLKGYTCSQAVVLAFSDVLPAPEETLLAISRPFGGGMGRLRLTCGGVSGGVMALGLLFPEAGKSELYAIVQDYARRFSERNGSVVCAELLAGAGIAADRSVHAEARTGAYYAKRPCPRLVGDAAEALEEVLKERGIL